MFHLRRLPEPEIHARVAAAAQAPADSPRFLSFENCLDQVNLRSFSRDQSQSHLGRGETAFATAKRAFTNWQMFDLGWVRVVNSTAPIACGELVAVEVHSLGLWTLNLSRIVETVDSETQFGYVYATTLHHVEQGEERFLLRLDPETGEVSYELEAVSRPRHILAKIAYPITRHFQHKFARDSHRRMQQAVNLKV